MANGVLPFRQRQWAVSSPQAALRLPAVMKIKPFGLLMRHCDCEARSRQQSRKPLFPQAPLVARAIPPPFLPLFAYFQSFNKGIGGKLGAFESTKGAFGNKGSLAFSLNLMTLGRASPQRGWNGLPTPPCAALVRGCIIQPLRGGVAVSAVVSQEIPQYIPSFFLYINNISYFCPFKFQH